MAICSSIAEPVLVFQFPDTDVLLGDERGEILGDLNCIGQSRGLLPRLRFLHSHVGLVVLPNLLDAYVIFGVNEGLSSGIRLGQCHDTCDILEVMLVVHLDLWVGWGSGPWLDGAENEGASGWRHASK